MIGAPAPKRFRPAAPLQYRPPGLVAVAGALAPGDPDRARYLIANALHIGDEPLFLTAMASAWPSTVRVIADEFVNLTQRGFP